MDMLVVALRRASGIDQRQGIAKMAMFYCTILIVAWPGGLQRH